MPDKIHCKTKQQDTLVQNNQIRSNVKLFYAYMDKDFKNGPSKICGRQPLKNFKQCGLILANHNPSIF